MKTILAFLLIAFIACNSSTGPRIPMGTAYFTMDGVSCPYTGSKAVTFYIGPDEVGTENLGGGATSLGYYTKASRAYPKKGNPVVQARIANYTSDGKALWTSRWPLEVPANGSATQMVGC